MRGRRPAAGFPRLGHLGLCSAASAPVSSASHPGPSLCVAGWVLTGAPPPQHPVTSLSDGGSCISRDNVLVRHGSAADHTDHGLQAHAGPTDLDVAMFHRDAAGGGGSGQRGGMQRVSPPFPFLLSPGGSSSCQGWGKLPQGHSSRKHLHTQPWVSWPRPSPVPAPYSKLAPRSQSLPQDPHVPHLPRPLPYVPPDLPHSRRRLRL